MKHARSARLTAMKSWVLTFMSGLPGFSNWKSSSKASTEVSPYPSFFLEAVDRIEIFKMLVLWRDCEKIAGRGLTLRQSQVLGWYDLRADGGKKTHNAKTSPGHYLRDEIWPGYCTSNSDTLNSSTNPQPNNSYNY